MTRSMLKYVSNFQWQSIQYSRVSVLKRSAILSEITGFVLPEITEPFDQLCCVVLVEVHVAEIVFQ